MRPSSSTSAQLASILALSLFSFGRPAFCETTPREAESRETAKLSTAFASVIPSGERRPLVTDVAALALEALAPNGEQALLKWAEQSPSLEIADQVGLFLRGRGTALPPWLKTVVDTNLSATTALVLIDGAEPAIGLSVHLPPEYASKSRTSGLEVKWSVEVLGQAGQVLSSHPNHLTLLATPKKEFETDYTTAKVVLPAGAAALSIREEVTIVSEIAARKDFVRNRFYPIVGAVGERSASFSNDPAANALDEKFASLLYSHKQLVKQRLLKEAAIGYSTPLLGKELSISTTTWRFNPINKPLDEGQINLKGKVTIIDIWATWCAPCVKALPELSALAVDNQDKNLTVISLVQDLNPRDTRGIDKLTAELRQSLGVLKGNGFTVRDTKSVAETGAADNIAKSVKLPVSLPHYFVTDREGTIRYSGADLAEAKEKAIALLQEIKRTDVQNGSALQTSK